MVGQHGVQEHNRLGRYAAAASTSKWDVWVSERVVAIYRDLRTYVVMTQARGVVSSTRRGTGLL